MIIGFYIFYELNKVQTNDTKQYLNEVTLQYKNILLKQIDGDLQTLEALSTFIEQTGTYDKEELLATLEVENNKNKFISMGYVSKDNIGYNLYINGDKYYDVDVSDELFILQALSGQRSVSKTIEDKYTGDYVNCYGVPVYQNGVVIGALTASNRSDTFASIMNQPLFNKEGYTHMIDNNGTFVIRSSHDSVPSDMLHIFDHNFIDASLREDLLDATNHSNDFFTSFRYQNKDYWMTLIPVGVNNWYICSIVPHDSVNGNFTKLSQTFAGILLFIFCLFAILFYYISSMTRKNKKNMYGLAYFDAMTGAYNKNKFYIEAQKLLTSGGNYALVMLDIGNFKFINELFGYKTGDFLLKYIIKTCAKLVRTNELYFRDSADNFGLLMHYSSRENMNSRVLTIMDEISRCSLDESQQFNIVCNCGVKVIDSAHDEIDLDVFIDRANLALKAAKGNHENTLVFYDDNLHDKAIEKTLIENRMYTALEQNEFLVYLQPKFDLKTNTIHSAEALVRWQLPDGTMIFPDTFIPLFEQNGFITVLDMYMLEEVCKLLHDWISLGYPVVPISVNQSRILFYKENYMEKIQDILCKYHIDPSYIILEVTEGITMDNIKIMEDLILGLHQIGFSVSMDDFGSGYSSLNILKELSIDELKLDKVFLTKTSKEAKRNSIMKSIIALAKELAIVTVAEGIETKEQSDFLLSIGCDIGQGYYFAKPMDLFHFKELAFPKD